MRHHKTTGIIIKRRDIGEADRILTVFTKDEGKIEVRAKGVRKITSKRASHIELLNTVSLALYASARGYILTEAVAIDTNEYLKQDLTKIGLLYHVCELIDGLCPENQEHTQIYFVLEELLDKFKTKINLAEAIHQFEIDLLTLLGYYSQQDLTGSKASFFIESILERKLKTRQILPHLL